MGWVREVFVSWKSLIRLCSISIKVFGYEKAHVLGGPWEN